MTKFNDIDFLVYSSHKTCTQTLVSIFNKNTYTSKHCHSLNNLKYNLVNPPTKETFIQYLIDFKKTNSNKIKIISCVRNPINRLLSSFFQSFSTDEIEFLNKKEKDTTVSIKNEIELSIMYEEKIKNSKLHGRTESLDELSQILNINILEQLENKKDYYFFDHDLFELYVLDFNCVIGENILDYLNKILKLDLTISSQKNLSKNKHYFKKYQNVKTKIGGKLDSIIKKNYDKFYFTAF